MIRKEAIDEQDWLIRAAGDGTSSCRPDGPLPAGGYGRGKRAAWRAVVCDEIM